MASVCLFWLLHLTLLSWTTLLLLIDPNLKVRALDQEAEVDYGHDYGAYSGQSRASGHLRILAGTNATLGEFPYSVKIRVTTNDSKSICSGSIVGHRHILTAAHCLKDANEMIVFLGELDTTTSDDGEIEINAIKWVEHPEYEFKPASDLGILELERNIPFRETAGSVGALNKIELANEYRMNETVTIAGWGLMGDKKHSKHLQKMDVSTTKCRNDSTLCYSPVLNRTITCPGDSGAGLVRKTVKGYLLIGVHSRKVKPNPNSGCGVNDALASDITVAKNYDWIKRVISGTKKPTISPPNVSMKPRRIFPSGFLTMNQTYKTIPSFLLTVRDRLNQV